MRKLRILRKIAKIVNCAKKKTNPQLGLAIFAKIAKNRNFRKNRDSCRGLVFSSFSVLCDVCDFNDFSDNNIEGKITEY